ncbi:MAG: hypothetical protein ABFR62_14105, partial [Bacteroidota bacterium]
MNFDNSGIRGKLLEDIDSLSKDYSEEEYKKYKIESLKKAISLVLERGMPESKFSEFEEKAGYLISLIPVKGSTPKKYLQKLES